MSIREAREQDVPAMLEIYDEFVKNTAVSFEYEQPLAGQSHHILNPCLLSAFVLQL